jgi:cyanophycin synthetase
MEATRRALDRSRPGDLVVLCVDYATEVYRELESRTGAAAPQVLRASEDGATVEAAGGDPDLISADA